MSQNVHAGRAYLVIGAGGGIGGAVARQLAAADARLTLMGRTEATLQSLASEIGGEVVAGDAARFDAVEDAVAKTVDAYGQIDGVLNGAGSILLKPAHLTTMEELQSVMSQNVVSAFAVVRSAAKAMKKNSGSIVLMSSAAAQIGLANHEAIAAAKAGVEGLTRAAAATYAAQNTRVNAIAPGLVDTGMSAKITGNDMALKASTAMHPLGRVGKPEDLADAVCWLLGTGSSWVTGQVIGIDGGLAQLKTRSR